MDRLCNILNGVNNNGAITYQYIDPMKAPIMVNDIRPDGVIACIGHKFAIGDIVYIDVIEGYNMDYYEDDFVITDIMEHSIKIINKKTNSYNHVNHLLINAMVIHKPQEKTNTIIIYLPVDCNIDNNTINNTIINTDYTKNDTLAEYCYINDKPLILVYDNIIQPIVPYVTERYKNLMDDITYPECIIKNFPNSIHHTILWAKEYINNLKINKIPTTWEECCIIARNIFEKEFNHRIINLLTVYPRDHMVDDMIFWSRGKLCPKPLEFDPFNDIVINVIYSLTTLLCDSYNIDNKFTFDDIVFKVSMFIMTKPTDLYEPTISVTIKQSINKFADSAKLMSNIEKCECICMRTITIIHMANAKAYCYNIPTENYDKLYNIINHLPNKKEQEIIDILTKVEMNKSGDHYIWKVKGHDIKQIKCTYSTYDWIKYKYMAKNHIILSDLIVDLNILCGKTITMIIEHNKILYSDDINIDIEKQINITAEYIYCYSNDDNPITILINKN